MSMNFSEFRRLLGADPNNQDPEFLAARRAGEEYSRAAAEADAFEEKLERAMRVGAPDDLEEALEPRSDDSRNAGGLRWRGFAIAASVVIALGAAIVGWNMNREWDSVEAYVAEHYAHDGERLLARSGDPDRPGLAPFLGGLGVRMDTGLADTVQYYKHCPTPSGKGAHLVIDTEYGKATVIYMPGTAVSDGIDFRFDGMRAHMLVVAGGSVAVIGAENQSLVALYARVQEAFQPLASSA
jgi:hypothetical protein